MKVLYFEVGKIGIELEVVRIQKYKNVILVCNEEGRLLNLPPNRTLKNSITNRS